MAYGIQIEVWGERALFTRPELSVERVSYDVITPSAARGLIESIYWLSLIHICPLAAASLLLAMLGCFLFLRAADPTIVLVARAVQGLSLIHICRSTSRAIAISSSATRRCARTWPAAPIRTTR